jgi:hypothetical protein
MERTCKKCGETKPIEEFYKDRGSYRSACKMCYKDLNRSYLQANRNKVCDHQKKYYQENKEKYKAYVKENEEYILKQRKMRYERDGQIMRAKHRGWLKNNKEHVKEYSKLYYAQNKDIQSEKKKMFAKELTDGYIIGAIQHAIGYNSQTIRQNPKLIKLYRQQIEHHRKYNQLQQSLKLLKNENIAR